MLKAKIQQRPPRQELERRHILEVDPNHVDPSLAERQRMLKKAKLADQLNDQLSHRPGPLELIQKNILHTEEPIEEAVKNGRIPYKATSEGQLNRPQLPSNYINPEEDSQSSEGDNIVSPGPSDVIETAAKSAGIVVSLIQPVDTTVLVTTTTPVSAKDNSEIVFDLCRSVGTPILSHASSPASLISSTSTLSPLSSVASPIPPLVSPATPVPPPPPPIPFITRTIPSPSNKSDAPGKDKNRKKAKSKAIPKTRTIKFHEYKGPPNAQKNNSSNPNSSESSYDLLLKQQTLLLQCQLQLQHKFPQIILPALQKNNTSENNNNNNNNNLNTPQPSPAPSTSSESSIPTKIASRLEDMKVSDLKTELKRRSLPVSGSKPQLIERLKPFITDIINQNINESSVSLQGSISMDHSHNSPSYQNINSPQESTTDDQFEHMDIDPTSPKPEIMQDHFLTLKTDPKSNEELVREQQKTIEELQRKLTLSEMKLQAATRPEPKAQMIALQKHLQARQQLQQQRQQQQLQQPVQSQQNIALHMKQLQALQTQQTQANEEQQRLQQQQHIAFQNQKGMNGIFINGTDTAIVFQQIVQGKARIFNGHTKTNSLPNFINTIVSNPVIASQEIKTECVEEPKHIRQEIKIEINDQLKEPPLYDEATKQMNKKNHIKSQIIDDVLEILIKNGELPPSAANDPSTPGSAGTKINELIYPQDNVTVDNQGDSTMIHSTELNSPETALGIDPNDLLETLDNFDNMDFSQLVMELGSCQNNYENNNMQTEATSGTTEMETDDWLDSLLPNENACNGSNETNTLNNQDSDFLGYDPLLGITQDAFDPFNLDDFRTPNDLTLPWDKIDYAA